VRREGQRVFFPWQIKDHRLTGTLTNSRFHFRECMEWVCLFDKTL
jgi:hypothetical protein